MKLQMVCCFRAGILHPLVRMADFLAGIGNPLARMRHFRTGIGRFRAGIGGFLTGNWLTAITRWVITERNRHAREMANRYPNRAARE